VAKEQRGYLGCHGRGYTTPPATTGTTEHVQLRGTNPYGNAQQRCYADGHQRPGTADDHDGTGESFVTVGQTANFSVIATGSSPLAYVWQKNGATIAGAARRATRHRQQSCPTTDPPSGVASFSNSAGSRHVEPATLTVSNTPPPAVNILANPGFETGTSPWSFYMTVQGRLRPSLRGSRCSRAAASALHARHERAVYQNNLVLCAHTITSFFNAYSTTGRDFAVSLLQQVTPRELRIEQRGVNIGTTWQFFSRQFRTSGFGARSTMPVSVFCWRLRRGGRELLPRRGCDSEGRPGGPAFYCKPIRRT